MINRQIPKREENLTVPTQALLQSKQRVLMGSGGWCVAHVGPLRIIVVGDNLLEQPLIILDALDDQLRCFW